MQLVASNFFSFSIFNLDIGIGNKFFSKSDAAQALSTIALKY